jgi:transposase-like protein
MCCKILLIYTTDPIEAFNRTMWKAAKRKGIFPREDALLKSLFYGCAR